MNDIKWPEDPFERLEAKIDNLRDNHLHTLQADMDGMKSRADHLEQSVKTLWDGVNELTNVVNRRQSIGFLMGVATLILIVILVI